MGASAPKPPARGFQIPWTRIIGCQGPPLVGIETPLWPLWFTWQRRGTFCLAQDPFIRAWHGPCENKAGDPGGLVGPPPPLRHQPRPPGCPFLDLPKALYEGLYVVQVLLLPGLQGFGRRRRGGRETRPRPAVSPDMDFAGPSVPAWIGPTGPGVSIRAAGEFAVWIAKRECLRKLERRDPPGNDDSGPLVL